MNGAGDYSEDIWMMLGNGMGFSPVLGRCKCLRNFIKITHSIHDDMIISFYLEKCTETTEAWGAVFSENWIHLLWQLFH